MKTTSILLAFLFTLLQGKLNIVTAKSISNLSQLQPEEEECIQELQLNRQEMMELNSLDNNPDDNEDFNSFIRCTWQKMAWQDSNGIINYENIKTMVGGLIEVELADENPAAIWWVKQKIIAQITDCEQFPTAKGASYGQTAVRVQNCLKNLKFKDWL